MWTIDPFVGTWRDASPSSASEDFTLFIAKTGSGYKATLRPPVCVRPHLAVPADAVSSPAVKKPPVTSV